MYEDLGQTFLLRKVKVAGIYFSRANEDIAKNPVANSPNFILCLRAFKSASPKSFRALNYFTLNFYPMLFDWI